MTKTLGNLIDYVEHIYVQIKADAGNFTAATGNKRREAHIHGRIKELEANYTEAKIANLKIIAAKEETNLKEKYFAEEVFINLKEAYLDYLGELNDALTEGNKEAGNISNATDGAPDIKLRRIELPIFAGGYEQWTPFYELYMSLIHNNQLLTDIEKLHYLKSSVKGEAARLLQHVALETKNYESAWTILTERYENKRVLVNTHLRVLLSQKQIQVETASSIKSILDTTTECIHSLRNLGVPVDKWDTILIYLLCSKLPCTKESWEQNLQGTKSLVEFTTFTKFLETRFRTLESIEQSRIDNRRTYPQGASTNPGFHRQVKAFHINFVNKPSKSSTLTRCVVCKENHTLPHCPQFIKMDIKRKFEIVHKHAACLNCLSHTHLKRQCPSKCRCKHCKQLHHSLLHSTTMQSGQLRTQESPNYNYTAPHIAQHVLVNQNHKQQSNSRNVPQHSNINTTQQNQFNAHPTAGPSGISNHNQNIQTLFTQRATGTKLLLATALIQCQSVSGNNITLRALIDPGSEATFITEAAVQNLKLQKRKTSTNIISLGQSKTGTSRNRVTLTISSTYTSKLNLIVDALVYNNITSILPAIQFENQNWEHLEGLQLADPLFHIPGQIDILLGADAYAEIILAGLKKGPPGSPIAQNSELGWIVSGNIYTQEKTNITHYPNIWKKWNNEYSSRLQQRPKWNTSHNNIKNRRSGDASRTKNTTNPLAIGTNNQHTSRRGWPNTSSNTKNCQHYNAKTNT